MSDQVRTVTSVSWLGRIQRSVGGVLFGVVLVLAMVGGLFWNEGRAVQTEKALAEGAGAVVSVPADRIDPAQDGRLVHVSGPVTTAETLSDPEFGISAQGVRLVRKVEMFQWVESESSKTETRLGGGEETVTTYTYKKEWHEGAVDSSDFQESSGHENPEPALSSQAFQVEDARLGAFALTDSILADIGNAEPLEISADQKDAILAASSLGKKISMRDGVIQAGLNPGSPEVGDLRISYELVPLGDVSIVAAQEGDSFAPYQTQAGDALQLVDVGSHDAAQMFKTAGDENNLITWLLRIGGLVLLVVGFMLITGPLGVLADVLPFLGSLVRLGTGLVALVLGLGIGTLTIALAWFWYRPLLSVIILAVGALVVGGIVYLARNRKPAAPAAA